MKTWALGAVVISMVAVVACGSSSTTGGTKGTGGSSGKTSTSTTGTTVSASHAASTAATTGTTTGPGGAGGSSGGGTCMAPSAITDCGSCANQTDCINCASMVDQAGVQDYNNLLNCVFCNSCYTTCDGAAANSGCASALDGGAPVEDTTCDTGTPGMTTCGACQMCSVKSGGSCSAGLTACEGVPQCIDLLKNLSTTCGGLPAM